MEQKTKADLIYFKYFPTWFCNSVVLNLPNTVTLSYSSQIISSLLHNCNFATVMNHYLNIRYVGYLIWDPWERGRDPQVENHRVYCGFIRWLEGGVNGEESVEEACHGKHSIELMAQESIFPLALHFYEE